jgi:hypothetical protein
MTTTCKNCGQHFKGHFCNNCGQPASTHEINFHFLWHDIQHGFFHFDKGIFYTAQQLFTRPGHSIREFIDGKRVKHFKPISLVIILATVYGLLSHTFHITNVTGEISITGIGNEKISIEMIKEWQDSHYAWVSLLTLPFYALGTFIAFRKQGYNFMEHLVLNAFLAGQRLFFHIVVFPIIYILNSTPNLKSFTDFLSFADFLLMVWAFSQFFNNLSKIKTFWRTLYMYVVFIASFAVIGLLILTVLSFM